jgi:hypothetical protein
MVLGTNSPYPIAVPFAAGGGRLPYAWGAGVLAELAA